MKSLSLTAVVLLAKVIGLSAAMVLSLIDPAWAVPLQTLLTIVLVVITSRTRTTQKEVHKEVMQAKANATHAASAAAAAAAVARDSNRIMKDVGAAMRRTEPPNGGTE